MKDLVDHYKRKQVDFRRPTSKSVQILLVFIHVRAARHRVCHCYTACTVSAEFCEL